MKGLKGPTKPEDRAAWLEGVRWAYLEILLAADGDYETVGTTLLADLTEAQEEAARLREIVEPMMDEAIRRLGKRGPGALKGRNNPLPMQPRDHARRGLERMKSKEYPTYRQAALMELVYSGVMRSKVGWDQFERTWANLERYIRDLDAKGRT